MFIATNACPIDLAPLGALHRKCPAWFLERTSTQIRTGSDSDQPNTQLFQKLERLFVPDCAPTELEN